MQWGVGLSVEEIGFVELRLTGVDPLISLFIRLRLKETCATCREAAVGRR